MDQQTIAPPARSDDAASPPLPPARTRTAALRHPAARRSLNARSLAMALAFMETNLGARFSLDELAQSACVSRAHFSRSFRNSTGLTPMAYLM